MKTCVSFIKAHTAIKELNIALKHETTCDHTTEEVLTTINYNPINSHVRKTLTNRRTFI